ncbi:hypothetical protein N8I77_007469 [Diaporthe amygdali]|uniref:Ketoreductase domain-containing protein n=1 Tax=Phomopsis amygdali TaxID=1214568 RepID=A0AAD9W1L3_PHOAM|nr:hypothetical protein N8I77_007469 [Diaporthe amygdali]
MSDAPPFPSPTKRWHTKAQPSTSPTRPELSAKGKSVIITGGGTTGIGGETARHFAQAGASRIALLGRREGPLLDNKAHIEKEHPGVEVFAISTDVTKQGEVDAAFARFAGGGGKVDVLVHSAAAIGPGERVSDVDGEMFLEGVQANVAGALWVAKAFIAVYRLWDTVALTNPDLSIFHTQPGVILTEMNLEVGGAESMKDVQVDDVSLPASFNVWLASPEARFLKGKFLWCNWDVDELKAQAEEIEKGTKLSIGLVGWPFND